MYVVGADSVSEAVLQSVSDKERKRQEAIFELLTSERQYVDSLNLVKEVFFDPMAEQQILTVEEMAKVSCCVCMFVAANESMEGSSRKIGLQIYAVWGWGRRQESIMRNLENFSRITNCICESQTISRV